MRYSKGFLVSFLLLVGWAITANAQSQDRDNPTPLVANTIKGNGIGKKVEYYYSFTAGPGEVALTVDLKAKAGSTSAEVEIFDEDASKIFYYYPNATSQNERAIKRITLSGKQLLTLRLALDSSAGDYSIKVAGPVEVATPAVASGPTADASAIADTPPAPPPSPPPSDAQPQPATGTPEPDSSSATPTETPTPKSDKGSKFDLGLNLLQTVGSHFGLPSSGMLHIVMKDGTTNDIDLSKVKSARLAKQ